MTGSGTNNNAAEPVVTSSRGGGISLIWLVPVFALLLGAGLTWQYYANLGPVITITFESAEGITPGATKVRYKQVEIGEVIEVGLDPGTDRVIIKARIDTAAQHLLGSETRFWIVKPRAGIGGISGIGTILGGTYIDTDPGGTAGATEFAGLEVPPLTPFSTPGLRITLRSGQERSIRVGTPVYYRQIRVGQVDGRRFADNFNVVELDLFIQDAYTGLITNNSRFWNASGLDVSITTAGADIRTPSLESLLEGGISFDTPPDSGVGEPAESGAEYLLFPDRDSALKSSLSEKVRYLLYFDGSVRGLSPGAPVEFLGIPVGEVVSVKLSYDSRTNAVSIPVLVEIDPVLFFGEPLDAKQSHLKVVQLVRQGLKAQLKSANLVTGQLLVELDMYPGDPFIGLADDSGFSVLPTVPNTITQISQGLEGLVAKLGSLEIEPTLAEIRGLAAELRDLTTGGMGGLTATFGPDGELHDQLVDALTELQKMADSLRQLSDTLVEKPNALLFGKDSTPATGKDPKERFVPPSQQ